MRVAKVWKFFLLFIVAVASTNCQKKNREKSCGCSDKAWLHVNFSIEPPNYDFRKTSCRTSALLAEMMYEGLMKVKRDGSIQPAQAEKVVISPDGLRYTFYLGNNYWSDGSAVTARDFAETWRENLDPNFPSVYTHLFYCIKNAQAAKEGKCPLTEVGLSTEGDKILIVDLEQPTAYFLCLTTSAWYFPFRAPPEETKGSLVEGDVISNGPFRLQKWQHGQQIHVVKNARYRDAEDIHLQGIRISLINDENTAAELFEQGDFDLLGLPFSPIPNDFANKLADKNVISPNPVGGVTVCCFNTTRAPFNCPKVRRALSMALDRRQLIDVVFPSAYAPANTLVPAVFLQAIGVESVASRNREQEIESARRDFEAAIADLQLTREDFPLIKLSYNQNKNHTLFQRLAEVMQQNWQDILGVKVELQGLETQSVIQKMIAKDYDTAMITWTANYQDPMSFLDKFLLPTNPKNYPGWFHEAFNASILHANSTLDMKKRAEFFAQAEKIFAEEAPCAPLFHWSYPIIIHPRVQGLHISPSATIDYSTLHMVPHVRKEHKKIVKQTANKI